MYRYDTSTPARTTNRRSTRSARGSGQRRRNFGGGKGPDSGGSSAASRIRKAARQGPARKWVQVVRPPGPNIRFTVEMWVPYEQLTEAEQKEYELQLLEEQRQREEEEERQRQQKEELIKDETATQEQTATSPEKEQGVAMDEASPTKGADDNAAELTTDDASQSATADKNQSTLESDSMEVEPSTAAYSEGGTSQQETEKTDANETEETVVDTPEPNNNNEEFNKIPSEPIENPLNQGAETAAEENETEMPKETFDGKEPTEETEIDASTSASSSKRSHDATQEESVPPDSDSQQPAAENAGSDEGDRPMKRQRTAEGGVEESTESEQVASNSPAEPTSENPETAPVENDAEQSTSPMEISKED